jgi:nicotinate-nucleotide pyrophosphorylase
MQNNIDQLILMALKEDIPHEDITTNSIIKSSYRKAKAQLICKQDGIVAGLIIFKRVFVLFDKTIETKIFYQDGDHVKKGEVIAQIEGSIKSILSAERTALNYLQRMSGIATHTKKIADLLAGSSIRLLDTRKTTPNNRIFEKYAVKVGGGYNHRFSLSDGIMLKDNHIAAAGGIKQAVEMVREYAPFVCKIEVEVENFDMIDEALDANVDIIMLDNMNLEDIKEAVKIINKRALIECSGNITIEKVNALKNIEIDYISSGALTHSSPILDFSLKNVEIIS